MKKSCKILLAAAAIAALVPYSRTKDAATGETNLQALLWRLRRVPKEDGDTHIEIFLGLYLPGRKNRERDLYDDDVLLGGAGRDDS